MGSVHHDSPGGHRTAASEVVDLCRGLLQIDSTNYGDGSGPGERAAAEHVAGLLAEVGIEPTILESAPGRTSVLARIPGADPTRTDALLLHGHLDVVPADPKEWRYDPFAGEVADGCLWGRGAVDMKDMDAMLLAVVRDRVRTGRLPDRPLVLGFLADEEAGGVHGSHWLVEHHPDWFADCTEAVSEVGGFSLTVRRPGAADTDERRAYLVQTAERGIAWLTVAATGTQGHGSLPHHDNAVVRLARALARIADHEWPTLVTPTMQAFLDGLEELTGQPLDPSDPAALRETLGAMGRLVYAGTRNSLNPTVLRAGGKTNQVPPAAEARLDGRFLPGQRDAFLATVDELLGPDVQRLDAYLDVALEAPFEGRTVAAMRDSLLAADPGSLVLPYTLFGGTDAKAFSRLGITGYGFAPLRLPPDLDFPALFHGVDERVPLDALTFGVGVLDDFLDRC
jgi:acetylornithine deacetylase/succinyl-diaminopimelate desuccinylase-like protein